VEFPSVLYSPDREPATALFRAAPVATNVVEVELRGVEDFDEVESSVVEDSSDFVLPLSHVGRRGYPPYTPAATDRPTWTLCARTPWAAPGPQHRSDDANQRETPRDIRAVANPSATRGNPGDRYGARRRARPGKIGGIGL